MVSLQKMICEEEGCEKHQTYAAGSVLVLSR
jgi:hypothetical protein